MPWCPRRRRRWVGVARGHLGEGWLIGHAINGGVLMALATSTASEVLAAVGHGDPLTWSAHFLSAAVPGPVEVHVEVLRVGPQRVDGVRARRAAG